MRFSKWSITLLICMSLLLNADTVFAQKSRSSSSRSSSSRSSSSRSSSSRSSSKPSSGMFGGSSSKPSTSKPSSGMFGGSSSKPSTSKPSTSKPSTSKPSTSKPSSGMFGGSSTSNNSTTSSRPTSNYTSSKSQAQKQQESKQAYLTTQTSVSPPRATAIVGGKSIKVEANSKSVTDLRNKPSTYIQPKQRTERITTHVVQHHYSHPYDYYNRPTYYSVGPYSNAFWWMMMEWNADRRAQWIYHNQARLSAEAYADVLRDTEVQKRLANLESQGVVRDPNYVDPEFADNPTDMYDQNYVEAAYNPMPMPSKKSPMAVIVPVILGVITGAFVAFLVGMVFFSYRWGK